MCGYRFRTLHFNYHWEAYWESFQEHFQRASMHFLPAHSKTIDASTHISLFDMHQVSLHSLEQRELLESMDLAGVLEHGTQIASDEAVWIHMQIVSHLLAGSFLSDVVEATNGTAASGQFRAHWFGEGASRRCVGNRIGKTPDNTFRLNSVGRNSGDSRDAVHGGCRCCFAQRVLESQEAEALPWYLAFGTWIEQRFTWSHSQRVHRFHHPRHPSLKPSMWPMAIPGLAVRHLCLQASGGHGWQRRRNRMEWERIKSLRSMGACVIHRNQKRCVVIYWSILSELSSDFKWFQEAL